MELSRGDRTWIIYRGPDGSRFWLSGMRGQGKQGVELAPGIVGLDRPPEELLWLQEARQNGADLVGSNVDVRTIRAAVNILGRTPRQQRSAFDRWNRSQDNEQYGKLAFINSYSGVKILDVLYGDSPSASIDKDPALRSGLIGYPVTWVCPNPYFKGYVEEFPWRPSGASSGGWQMGKRKVRHLGTAPRTYPQIYLPGPGTWRIPMGIRDENGNLPDYDQYDPTTYVELPPLKADEEAWLDTDPRVETITKKSASGVETNLWAKMKGQRPRLWLPKSRTEDWTLAVKGGSPAREAKIVVQPLYNAFN
jgi:hypothetical protein